MSTKHSTPCSMHLCRYAIASADMYYTELGERDVFMRTDKQGNFHILGKIVGGDASTEIGLCQIFLEYAMSCCAWYGPNKAPGYMQSFAQHIGHSIGAFIKESARLFKWDDPAERALEHLFQTMNAHFSIKGCGATEYFIVKDCPLENAAERTGLCNVELAHQGVNIMCQSMIETINREVTITASPTVDSEFAFIILKPEFA